MESVNQIISFPEVESKIIAHPLKSPTEVEDLEMSVGAEVLALVVRNNVPHVVFKVPTNVLKTKTTRLFSVKEETLTAMPVSAKYVGAYVVGTMSPVVDPNAKPRVTMTSYYCFVVELGPLVAVDPT